MVQKKELKCAIINCAQHDRHAFYNIFKQLSDETRNYQLGEMIKTYSSFPSSVREPNTTLLHMAAEEDNIPIATLLIDKGHSVDIPSFYGTPLSLACNNNIHMAKLLLEKGANTNLDYYRKNIAFNPLSIACKNSNLKLVQLLVEHGAKPELCTNTLEFACKNGNAEILSVLLKAGANANSKTYHESHINNRYARHKKSIKETILHLAARHCFIDGIKLLVEKGADFYAKNADGQTASDVALSSAANACQRKRDQYIAIVEYFTKLMLKEEQAKREKQEKDEQAKDQSITVYEKFDIAEATTFFSGVKKYRQHKQRDCCSIL